MINPGLEAQNTLSPVMLKRTFEGSDLSITHQLQCFRMDPMFPKVDSGGYNLGKGIGT